MIILYFRGTNNNKRCVAEMAEKKRFLVKSTSCIFTVLLLYFELGCLWFCMFFFVLLGCPIASILINSIIFHDVYIQNIENLFCIFLLIGAYFVNFFSSVFMLTFHDFWYKTRNLCILLRILYFILIGCNLSLIVFTYLSLEIWIILYKE